LQKLKHLLNHGIEDSDHEQSSHGFPRKKNFGRAKTSIDDYKEPTITILARYMCIILGNEFVSVSRIGDEVDMPLTVALSYYKRIIESRVFQID